VAQHYGNRNWQEVEIEMKYRFTVIFEKEDEGGYHVFSPLSLGVTTRVRPWMKVSRTFARLCNFTSRHSWKTDCPFQRKIF
jgi:hypothetical protein